MKDLVMELLEREIKTQELGTRERLVIPFWTAARRGGEGTNGFQALIVGQRELQVTGGGVLLRNACWPGQQESLGYFSPETGGGGDIRGDLPGWCYAVLL